MSKKLGRGTVKARWHSSALRKAKLENSASFKRQYKITVHRISPEGKYGMATWKVVAIKKKKR